MQIRDASELFETKCTSSGSCPFSHGKCLKVKRQINPVCSYYFKGNSQIICPNRFLAYDFLGYISNFFFPGELTQILKEVKLGNNYVDFVIVSKDDYVAVELQSLDTCGSYLHFDDPKNHKPFCINWKTTAKTIISQLISKVGMFKEHGRKVVLVIQDSFMDYLKNQGIFKTNELNKKDDLLILSLSIKPDSYGVSSFSSLSYGELVQSVFREKPIDIDSLVFERAQAEKEKGL